MQKTSSVLLQFGKRVRELRLSQGLSQEDLAALCSLDRTYISSIERGKRNVSLKNIAAIAQSLHISISYLLEGVSSDD
ncbi:MAG: helix-turn-helix transcriptional regulator [Chloroflexi bacterium]|nr:XRE family transcriptional regulator [Chloroflexota bacterium]NOG65351.1 helix-turn-helix transcriptional regulator [Chloroflexota bacterium]